MPAAAAVVLGASMLERSRLHLPLDLVALRDEPLSRSSTRASVLAGAAERPRRRAAPPCRPRDARSAPRQRVGGLPRARARPWRSARRARRAARSNCSACTVSAASRDLGSAARSLSVASCAAAPALPPLPVGRLRCAICASRPLAQPRRRSRALRSLQPRLVGRVARPPSGRCSCARRPQCRLVAGFASAASAHRAAIASASARLELQPHPRLVERRCAASRGRPMPRSAPRSTVCCAAAICPLRQRARPRACRARLRAPARAPPSALRRRPLRGSRSRRRPSSSASSSASRLRCASRCGGGARRVGGWRRSRPSARDRPPG